MAIFWHAFLHKPPFHRAGLYYITACNKILKHYPCFLIAETVQLCSRIEPKLDEHTHTISFIINGVVTQ